MSQLFELVVIAFLLLISIELLLVYREAARVNLGRRVDAADEPSKSGGQTINVTVGTPAGGTAPVIVSEEKKLLSDDPLTPVTATEPEIEESEVPKKPALSSQSRATSSGLIAKKCPSCGNENSSYRTECFNCGAKL